MQQHIQDNPTSGVCGLNVCGPCLYLCGPKRLFSIDFQIKTKKNKACLQEIYDGILSRYKTTKTRNQHILERK